MKAWQYGAIHNGIEKSLKINTSAPMPSPKADQHLVKVLANALNPVDYKPAEVGLMRRLAIPNPATPGIDFVGRIVKPSSQSSLKEGQLIFGFAGTSAFAAGGMAEYAAVPHKAAVAVPEGLSPTDAASIPVVGMTAYQSIMPHVKEGSRVFINGGSGGTGVFGIQIAKQAKCHVTTTCSTPNVDLCKSLGADEVIDYKKVPVLETLKKQKPFDHVVDNVGGQYELFWRAHEYTTPSAKYVYVAGVPSLSFAAFVMKAKLWPGFLGGAKRPYTGIFAEPHLDELTKLGQWIADGKMRTVIDETFPFEKAPEAFKKLKTSRAKGKIIVDVALNSA